MRALAVLVAVPALLTAAPAAAAPPKIAALILKTGDVDVELADNLTEVLIGRLARRGDYEIAGKEELKSKLGVDDRAAADCIQNMNCLGRAGTELGVTRLVVGTLGKRGSDYLYNLSLIDLSTGRAENRVFEMVAGGKVDALIRAVQSTADKLFQPKVEPGGVRVESETRGAMVYLDDAFIGASPVRRDGVEPGAHRLRIEKEGHLGWAKEIEVPAGSTLTIKVPLEALRERRKWPTYLAISLVVLSAATGVIGTVLIALSKDAPTLSAVTRAAAISDASDRFVDGRGAIALLAVAGGSAATAAILALVFRKDMFAIGEQKLKRAALDLAPTLGGATLQATVRW
jgi:PEGA domain